MASPDNAFPEFELPDDESPVRPRKVQKTATQNVQGGGGPSLAPTDLPPSYQKTLSSTLVQILKDMQRQADDTIKQAKKTAPKGTRADANTYWYTLAKPVVKKFAPDYTTFVPVDKEMWLDKVKSKASTNRYKTVEHFLSDIHMIRDAALAYNSPGCGKHAFPPAVELAVGMVAFVEGKLSRCVSLKEMLAVVKELEDKNEQCEALQVEYNKKLVKIARVEQENKDMKAELRRLANRFS